MSDDIRINASDLVALRDSGDIENSLETFFNKLEEIATLLETEGNPNFIIGKVIVVNDIADEEEESEDDESDDETATETKET
jgi:hypothetical protein